MFGFIFFLACLLIVGLTYAYMAAGKDGTIFSPHWVFKCNCGNVTHTSIPTEKLCCSTCHSSRGKWSYGYFKRDNEKSMNFLKWEDGVWVDVPEPEGWNFVKK